MKETKNKSNDFSNVDKKFIFFGESIWCSQIGRQKEKMLGRGKRRIVSNSHRVRGDVIWQITIDNFFTVCNIEKECIAEAEMTSFMEGERERERDKYMYNIILS